MKKEREKKKGEEQGEESVFILQYNKKKKREGKEEKAISLALRLFLNPMCASWLILWALSNHCIH